MKKKIVAGIAVFAMIVLVISGAWYITKPPVASQGMPEQIVIGTTIQELAGLIFIAEDAGFFTGNGLNVTLRYYDTGLAAVNGMTDGDVDIAASAEYPVVGTVLKQENISVIGSIDKYQGQYIVGRKDHGIENVADLQDKKNRRCPRDKHRILSWQVPLPE